MTGLMVRGVLIPEGVAGLPAELREVFVAETFGVGGPEGVAGVFADFGFAATGSVAGRRWERSDWCALLGGCETHFGAV